MKNFVEHRKKAVELVEDTGGRLTCNTPCTWVIQKCDLRFTLTPNTATQEWSASFGSYWRSAKTQGEAVAKLKRVLEEM